MAGTDVATTDKTRAKLEKVEAPERRVVDHDRPCVFCHEVVRERDKTKTRVWSLVHGTIIAAAHQKCVAAC